MIMINRGVEYHVYFDKNFDYYKILTSYIDKYKVIPFWEDGKIIIANTKNTDKRLMESSYYKERCETWFEDNDFRQTPINIVDIELTSDEKDYLEFILTNFKDAVIRHGWYDVNYYS